MFRTHIANPKDPWHTLTIKARGRDELILMGRGKEVQLSIWTDSVPGNFAWFGGRATLRRLAHEILKATR